MAKGIVPIDPIFQLKNSKERDRFYGKLDAVQKDYYQTIVDTAVTCCNARAGTGKTFIATLAALNLLADGKVNKIFYIRYPDELSLKMGFFPGDKDEKEEIYKAPFMDAAKYLGLQPETIDELIDGGFLEITTHIGLRGRNLDNCIVISDESQNANLNDLKLVLTRVHDNSKVVLLGHEGQQDNKRTDHGFLRYIEHLCKKSWSKEIKLTKNYRGKISQWADELF